MRKIVSVIAVLMLLTLPLMVAAEQGATPDHAKNDHTKTEEIKQRGIDFDNLTGKLLIST